MVEVTFIEADGTRRVIEAKLGDPLMIAARDGRVRGIVAECGGSAMCATCHCKLVSGGPLVPPKPDEADTIEFNAHEPDESSRLICQVVVTEALAGAVFRVATGR